LALLVTGLAKLPTTPGALDSGLTASTRKPSKKKIYEAMNQNVVAAAAAALVNNKLVIM